MQAFFDQLAYFLIHKIFLVALYELSSRIVQAFNHFYAVGFIRLTCGTGLVLCPVTLRRTGHPSKLKRAQWSCGAFAVGVRNLCGNGGQTVVAGAGEPDVGDDGKMIRWIASVAAVGVDAGIQREQV